MARYSGSVGYAVDIETFPGVWDAQIVEHKYYGDVVKNKLSVQQSTTVNPTLTISNSISIVADAFAFNNYYAIRYITYLGKKWKVTSIEIERPRLILTLGGIYNG